MEGVARVFDAAKHMRAALFAGITLNSCRFVDNDQFVGIFSDAHLVTCDNGDLRKQGSFWLPTFATTANMIVGSLSTNGNFNGLTAALT